MTLLNRLFSKRKAAKQGYVFYGQCENDSWRPFKFSKNQVRVILFRECDWRGRKLLFDSKSVVKVNLSSCSCKFKRKCENQRTDTFVEVSNGCGYQYTRPEADTTTLGEMVFGAVAMTLHGTTLKVHSMKNPSRIMCTKVFHAPVHARRKECVSDSSLEDSYGSSVNSISENLSSGSNSDNKLGSGSFDSTSSKEKHPMYGDSGFSCNSSLESDNLDFSSCHLSSWLSHNSSNTQQFSGSGSLAPTSCHSGGSLSSLQRRWVRNMTTSLENEGGSTSSFSGSVGNEDSETGHSQRKAKLGLAVVLSLTTNVEEDMEAFCFEHMTVIESIIERLRYTVDKAYRQKNMFVHLMMEGYEEAQRCAEDLFSAPRIQNPVWLSLTNKERSRKPTLVYNFIQDLCHLLTNVDTKSTNFFVSTLVTAVLTHHLGWVNTVYSPNSMSHSTKGEPSTSELFSKLRKSHPYNPLWGQLGDLYGAVCKRTKIARTVVTSGSSKKNELLRKILIALTYFIRCGDVDVINDEYHFEEENTLINQSVPVETFKSMSDVCSKSTENLANVPIKSISSVKSMSNLCSKSTEIKTKETKDVPSINLLHSISKEVDNVDFPSEESVAPSTVHGSGLPFPLYNAECISLFKKEIKKLPPPVTLSARTVEDKTCSPACTEWETTRHDIVNSRKQKEKDLSSGNGVENVDLESQKNSKSYSLSLSSSSNPLFEKLSKSNLYPSLGMVEEAASYLFSSVKDGSPLLKNAINNSVKSEHVNSTHVSHKDVEQDFGHLGGMKRTSNISSKLNGVMNKMPYPKLYPNLSALMIEERVCSGDIPEIDTSYDALTLGSVDSKNGSESGGGQISPVLELNDMKTKCPELASPLSCVDIMKQSYESNDINKLVIEPSFQIALPQKISMERQRSSLASFQSKIVDYIDRSEEKNFEEQDKLEISSSKSVVFLLGDEKLDMENTRDKNSETCKEDETSVKNFSFSCDSPKTVTVQPSTIELESESRVDNPEFWKNYRMYTHRRMSYPLSAVNFRTPQICALRRFSSCLLNNNGNKVSNSYILPTAKTHRTKSDLCDSSGVKNSFMFGNPLCNVMQFSNGIKDFKKISGMNDSLLKIFSSVCSENNLKNGYKSIESHPKHFDRTFSKLSKCVLKSSSNFITKSSALSKYSSLNKLSDSQGKSKSNVDLSKSSVLLQYLPIPRFFGKTYQHPHNLGFAASFFGDVSDHYITDLVLQGCSDLSGGWESSLRRDLSILTLHNMLDQEVAESVCIVADTDCWEVQLVSSNTNIVDRPGVLGVRLGMSRLVANMLESLLNLWKLEASPEECLNLLESKLREICLRSQALAELMLTTEFCDMQFLTSSLDLDVNDIPLLMAVASTHTPLVTEKYGLSFR